MRCPKCHYLSFEPEARCRNCGYDLALAEDDLIIKAVDDDEEGPLQDFDLRDEGHARAAAPMTLGPLHMEPEPAAPEAPSIVALAAPPPPPLPGPRPVRPPSTTTELPLFMRASALAEADPEAPLVPMPPAPRPPLAVRRRSAEGALQPARVERTSMVDVAANLESVWAPLPATVPDLDAHETAHSDAPSDSVGALRRKVVERDFHSPVREPDLDRLEAADYADGSGSAARARIMAAGIDLALLGGIDVVVLWLTVKICALTFGDVLTLPLLPIAAFLLLVAAGYLVLFTAASGQTLGKMAARIRVVPEGDDHTDDPLSLRQAAVRSLATLPSVMALGVGFLPALGATGLAVHDRIAHTRVVRA